VDITADLIKDYDQVWFIDSTNAILITGPEVDAVEDYVNGGGNILLSGESASYRLNVNAIAQRFSASMNIELGLVSVGKGCVDVTVTGHPIGDGIASLGSSDSDVGIKGTNPAFENICNYVSGTAPEADLPCTAIVDTGTGKIVFDSSWYRFLDVGTEIGYPELNIDACNNRQYALNIAAWLAG